MVWEGRHRCRASIAANCCRYCGENQPPHRAENLRSYTTPRMLTVFVGAQLRWAIAAFVRTTAASDFNVPDQ